MPIYTVISEGLKLAYIVEIVKNPIYRDGMLNAFAIAFVTTVLVAMIAIPLAALNESFDFPGKNLVVPFVLLPMILPPFVGAIGFSQIFSRFGALNSLLTSLGLIEFGYGPDWLGGNGRFWAVCIVEALHLYPIMYLNVLASFGNLDPALNEAARNLGCGKIRRFFYITLPLIRSGLFAGTSIVFIWSFTELGAPLMLGFNRVSTVQIFNGITELETNPLPYALVVVVLATVCIIYAFSRFIFGKNNNALTVKGIVASRSRKISGLQGISIALLFIIVIILAALPHIGIILLSISGGWYCTFFPSSYTFEHFSNALSHPLVSSGIVNSLRYSLIATIISGTIGLLVAFIVVRWKNFAYQVLDVLAMMPLAVPGIVLAVGYLSMAVKYKWISSFADPVKNPTILLVCAYAIRRLPYVLRSIAAGLQEVPLELEDAARNLGANQLLAIRKITLPLISANLVIGAIFAFSFSMLEVSDSLILAQKTEFFPITRVIYELSQVLGSGPYLACAFGVWAMVFLSVSLLISSIIMGKTFGSLFRL
ncbi:MAG TPA: iron ABC transporter permease [Victivallales bacterium]|nr:iron ABC transporter permease [Victivallales bacterium]HRU01902.1 iron ABC transporter permease [Victivallales bacterium]